MVVVPKPHDPLRVPTPEEVQERVAAVLNEECATAQDQYRQLDRAHDVLRDVLQEN